MTAYLPLPLSVETDDFVYGPCTDLFPYGAQLGPVDSDSIFEGSDLLVCPLTIDVAGLGFLKLKAMS